MTGFLAILIIGMVTVIVGINGADDCANYPNGFTRPHESSCELFYVCTEKISVEKNCAPGLHYNAQKFYCQQPHEAGCDKTATTPDDGKTTTTTTTTRKPPGPVVPGSCKNQPLGKKIPFDGDCTKYIVCIGGGQVMQCPTLGQTYFNPELEVCDWKENVNCAWD